MIGPVLAFDVETIPDIDLGRRIHGLGDEIPDEDVVRAMEQLRMQKTGGHQFQPLYLQKVVCISVVYRTDSTLMVKSLEDPEADEKTIVAKFFSVIDRFAPRLVSWNGNGFDLAVLNYRALYHGIQATRFWETGDGERDFRFNNYISRYHERHLDLMDVLSRYNPRAVAGLDDISVALGFPGKPQGMSGSEVWPAWQDGRLAEIRQYCETDALSTYLVFLRFELLRGRLLKEEYLELCDQLHSYLEEEDQPHYRDFLSRWDRDGDPLRQGQDISPAASE